jgi:transposase
MKGDRLVINRPSELQVYVSRENDAKIRFKLAFLQCVAHLQPDLEMLCQAFGIATSTGYWWIRNWNQMGYEGLQESSGGNVGRPPRLDDIDIVYLASLLKEKTCWTTQEVRELIKANFGIEYSHAQVVRILRKRLKMHFSKPFPHDYRRPSNAEDILKERLENVFNVLKGKGFNKDDIALGFVDETSPQNRANTVRLWSFESSPIMIRNTDHFKSNTIGFYAIEGHSHQAFLANSKQESVQGFLEQIRAANPGYKAIVIVWDNYRSHKSAKVKETAEALGIYLVFLPAYSPDLNPEEYLWKSMKRELSKSFIKTVEEMKATITKTWIDLSNRLSFANHWIEEFLSGESYYSELCI